MSLNRDIRAIVHVACPHCGARPGERCRNPALWATPRSAQPTRPHAERRAAEQELRRPANAHNPTADKHHPG